jgi:menaquinone-9 beta-reductase
MNIVAQVVVLDKETFPRDKYCGDAVCTPAIRILDDMGVMKALADNNESHFADAGGFVSPSGLSYIGERLAACSWCACMEEPAPSQHQDGSGGCHAHGPCA